MSTTSRRRVFVTGGTGYLGRPLIRELLAREHSVRALVRPGSAPKLPAGTESVVGDALTAFEALIPPRTRWSTSSERRIRIRPRRGSSGKSIWFPFKPR